MNKSPDEIKKGLAYCVEPYCPGEKCPYWNAESCAQDKTYDALAYIQQLERDKTWAGKTSDMLREENKRLEAQNTELLKKVEQLQAENAQLLRDVHGKCGACKWMYADGFERVCDPCLSEIKDNFEWRGVQKED